MATRTTQTETLIVAEGAETEALRAVRAQLAAAVALDDAARFRVAAALLYAVGAELGYTPGKLNNNGITEALSAMHHGLAHSRAANGPDAYDAEGRGVEIKTSTVATSKARTKANFVYRIKPLKLASPSDADVEAHARAVERWWRTHAPGGHRLDVIERGAVAHSYAISCDFMARYLAERIRRKLTPLQRPNANLGCQPCQRCGDYHRVKHYAELSRRAAPLSDAEWDDVMTKRVDRNCR